MGYETHRIRSEPGEAPSSCRGIVQEREGYSRGRPSGSGLSRSRASLDSGLEEAWRSSVGGQADAGPAMENERHAARQASEAAARRGDGLRVSQRAVDVEAYCQADPQRVRRPLPPEPPVASPSGVRVELPGARTPRDPARRRGHRALDAAQVACNKKKPEGLAPTSSSSMRAASC